MDVSALQWSVLLLEVSATGPELNLDVSALRRYVSNPQGPVRVEHVRFASKIIFFCGYLYVIIYTKNSYMYLSQN